MSVEVINLDHVYSQNSPFEFHALKNISVNFETGDFIGLIGHTGSGKSTLIQHLNGLLRPTKGTVIIDDYDLFKNKKSNLREIRKRVGIVFQYPEHQLFEETVFKDVAFGPSNQGLDETTIKKRVKKAIETVGLDYKELKDKSPFELSGGQMRRVAIAGVLAMDPDVLILDEPTAALDPKGRDDILGKIKELHQEQGKTVILVSHSMEDIGRVVDRILVMYKGEVVFYDEPKEVFKESEKLEEIGLAVPEVTYLMKELKKKYPEIREDIYTITKAREVLLEFLEGDSNV
jgi:energy-coupling factor transport system ATP-binding protein